MYRQLLSKPEKSIKKDKRKGVRFSLISDLINFYLKLNISQIYAQNPQTSQNLSHLYCKFLFNIEISIFNQNHEFQT